LEIIIYCDGGVRGNGKENSIGGWGAVLQYGEHVKELYAGERNTTNNRMELTGAIKALEALKSTSIPVRVHCDSAYVVNGITSWVAGWKKRDWRKADKKPVENKELWQRLDELVNKQSDCRFVKVKGHSGVPLNELADQLANKAMDEISN
jgi:ribonuclease HI